MSWQHGDDREQIRRLIEDWVIWRDSGDWDRFLTLWHPEGRMMATWFQGTAAEFAEISRAGFERGVRILHVLGGTSVDVADDRAIAQTRMAIHQRADVEGVACDVVCTGRFYDFFERRESRWGLVLRQPIYEKDRLDPIDPAAHLELDRAPAPALSRGLPAPRLPPDPDRLRRQARHARHHRARARSVVPARREVAGGRGDLTRSDQLVKNSCSSMTPWSSADTTIGASGTLTP